jgi:multidrug efflux pump subunit AcrB
LKLSTNPATGEAATVQHTFDRFGKRTNDTTFYPSVIIGVTGPSHVDVIKLDNQMKQTLAKLQQQPQFQGYGATISATFADSIHQNLSELQRVLLEGLLAVLIVGSIVIAIRASVITVIRW